MTRFFWSCGWQVCLMGFYNKFFFYLFLNFIFIEWSISNNIFINEFKWQIFTSNKFKLKQFYFKQPSFQVGNKNILERYRIHCIVKFKWVPSRRCSSVIFHSKVFVCVRGSLRLPAPFIRSSVTVQVDLWSILIRWIRIRWKEDL